MNIVKRVIEEVEFVGADLIHNHTLRIFGLELTTAQRATERAHNAFVLGVDEGRRPGAPREPQRRREHLRLVT